MQKEHPIDRAMRPLRGVFIWGLIVSGPIFMMSYAWGVKQVYLSAPGWITAAVVIAHLATWLAIGSLIDIRQERLNLQLDGQHARHQPKPRVDPR